MAAISTCAVILDAPAHIIWGPCIYAADPGHWHVMTSPQQLITRQVRGFAQNVPKGQVDGCLGVQMPHQGLIHQIIGPIHGKCIRIDQHGRNFFNTTANAQGVRGNVVRAKGSRLAPTLQAIVGRHPNKCCVKGAIFAPAA